MFTGSTDNTMPATTGGKIENSKSEIYEYLFVSSSTWDTTWTTCTISIHVKHNKNTYKGDSYVSFSQ